MIKLTEEEVVSMLNLLQEIANENRMCCMSSMDVDYTEVRIEKLQLILNEKINKL